MSRASLVKGEKAIHGGESIENLKDALEQGGGIYVGVNEEPSEDSERSCGKPRRA